jgi:hypothetical protein
MHDILLERLKQQESLPVLFIGSGLSRRYLNLPNWADLLRHFCAECGLNYNQEYGRCDGNLAMMATHLLEPFHEVFWREPKYEQLRAACDAFEPSRENILKHAIAGYLRNLATQAIATDALQAELAALREANVDCIITTNWDEHLSELFPSYHVYTGQSELLNRRTHGVAEIYKIHGCIKRPETMVLTKKDYDGFDSRHAYLVSKLLGLLVEHPVFFLGYSFSDPHISKLLGAMANCLTDSELSKVGSRLHVVEWNPQVEIPVATEHTQQHAGVNVPFQRVQTNGFEWLFGVFSKLDRRIPARTLWALKEHVYRLVQSPMTNRGLTVLPFDESAMENVDVVLGVGVAADLVATGYRQYERIDVVRDFLFETNSLVPDRVTTEILPRCSQQNSWVPMYHYLRKADADAFARVRDRLSNGGKRIEDVAWSDFQRKPEKGRPARLAVIKPRIEWSAVRTLSLSDFLKRFPDIDRATIDVGELRTYLQTNFEEGSQTSSVQRSNLFKAIAALDWLENFDLWRGGV